RAAGESSRATTALRSWPGTGSARRSHGRTSRGGERGQRRARRRGALVPATTGAWNSVSELALAAFAAATGTHVVEEPRDRRFERFRRSFDATRYLAALGEGRVRSLGRP